MSMIRVLGGCLRYNGRNNIALRGLSIQPKIEERLEDKVDPEWNNSKPYSQVPGPSIYQLITRNLKGGKYVALEMDELFRNFYHEFGPMVKIPGFLGKIDTLICFDSDYFQKIYKTQGSMPNRTILQTLKYYRKNLRPDIFKEMTGLVTDEGKTWYKLRSTVNPVMLKPNNVFRYIPVIDEVSQDFITKIKQIRKSNNEMPDDFGTDLSKWSLESVAAIALDTRLGILMDDGTNADGKAITDAVKVFFELVFELEFKPSIWKYYKTEKFKRLIRAYDVFTDVIGKHVRKAVNLYENKTNDDSQPSILQQLLKIDRECAILMANDFVIAGIDTTTSALSGLLYLLASNPDKQENLRKEIVRILPDKSSKFTAEKLANMPYFRACLKESLRLATVTASGARTSVVDMVVGQYQIPKDVNIVMTNVIVYYDEEYFPQCNKYIPERWLKENETNINITPKKSNPFVFTPFGYGVRSCIGKRYAELEIEIVVSRLLQNFRLEWHHPPLRHSSGLINYPKDPLRFKIIDI